MTLGFEVNKPTLDMKMAHAAIQLRTVFDEIETITKWLANHPVIDSVDPLTNEPFNYTADEVYAIRIYFETFDAVRVANSSTFDAGRQMTGLE